VSFRLDYAGTDSRGRTRTCISRVRGEVTVVFTTGQTSSKNSPGNRREEDSGRDLPWEFPLEAYASLPAVPIPGAGPCFPARLQLGEVSLLFHHRRSLLTYYLPSHPTASIEGVRTSPRTSCSISRRGNSGSTPDN